jgi:hypothetical protein
MYFKKPNVRTQCTDTMNLNYTLEAGAHRQLPPYTRLCNIYEFCPYLKENTTLHHYKDQLVNAVQRNNPCLQ